MPADNTITVKPGYEWTLTLPRGESVTYIRELRRINYKQAISVVAEDVKPDYIVEADHAD